MEARRQSDGGYITLLATLIVSVFGMVVAGGLSLQSGLSLSTLEVLERSFLARNYADSCAEQGLFLVTQSESYTGSGNLDFNFGECEFSVEVGEGESIVESTGLVGETVRKVRVRAITEAEVGESATTTAIMGAVWSEPEDF